ncbi:MAG: hypothetical protein WKG07_39775 [Hymenobacter sp.]
MDVAACPTLPFAEKTCAASSTTCSATPSSTATPPARPRYTSTAAPMPTTPCSKCRTTASGSEAAQQTKLFGLFQRLHTTSRAPASASTWSKRLLKTPGAALR